MKHKMSNFKNVIILIYPSKCNRASLQQPEWSVLPCQYLGLKPSLFCNSKQIVLYWRPLTTTSYLKFIGVTEEKSFVREVYKKLIENFLYIMTGGDKKV